MEVSAQLPIIPLYQILSAGPITPASFMPGLAEYWEFTDPVNVLTTNAAITNWIGRLQGTILTNGAATLRPTNSASGTGWKGTPVLTNNPFVIGSNYTISIVFNYGGSFAGGLTPSLIGSNQPAGNNKNFYIGYIDAGGNKMNLTVANAAGTVITGGGTIPWATPMFDLMMTMSNAGAASKVFCYTNGQQLTVNMTGSDTASEAISYVGSGDADGSGQGDFRGFIQAIYIQTNYVGTAANASNVHYYRTNYLTPGASP